MRNSNFRTAGISPLYISPLYFSPHTKILGTLHIIIILPLLLLLHLEIMCKTMQEPIPFRNWLLQENPQTLVDPNPNNVKRIKENASSLFDTASDLKNMGKENSVIVFGRKGCCMSYVVKRLLQGLGVNPAVYEVDEEDENEVVVELEGIGAGDGKEGSMQFPAVFIGGRWFGGLERIMATHITGELTPLLKQAGALWL